jgi:hypothetical protein
MSLNTTHWIEKWKRIETADWPLDVHVEISNFGRIKSFTTNPDGKIIHGSCIQNYRSLNIRNQGKSINRYIHKLVAELFIPRTNEEACFVIHMDYDKQNNRVENLAWVTREELTRHNANNPAILTKKIPLRTKNYKLSVAQVLLIKQMLQTGKNRIKIIAKQFGITSTQVNRIKNGVNWKRVQLK